MDDARTRAKSKRYVDEEKPREKVKKIEFERVSSRGSYQREGEMSQTDQVVGYTRQYKKTQLVAEKDTPRSSISTSTGR